MQTDNTENFSYWKRAWQKWFVLAAGILQAISLSLTIQEYAAMAKIKDRIFSPVAWDSYALQQGFQCALNGVTAALFLGNFFIGMFARKQKVARVAEGVLLLVLTLIWGTMAVLLPIASHGGIKFLWLFILLTSLSGSVYAFWRSR